MARYTGPRFKQCRREKQDLFLHAAVRSYESKCRSKALPGAGPSRAPVKASYYAIQFREKQKIKRLYGMLEKQFHKYFEMARSTKGNSGLSLLNFLESRLDNVVYRMGFARTRSEARQLVSHKHVMIDGACVNIASFQVKPNMVVSLKPKVRQHERVQHALSIAIQLPVPAWLDVKHSEFIGTFLRTPEREEHYQGINESLVIELYSK